MIKEELVEKLPQPWLMMGFTRHNGVFYAVYVNPATGEHELWRQEPIPVSMMHDVEEPVTHWGAVQVLGLGQAQEHLTAGTRN